MELRDILGQPSVAAIKMATLDSVCTYQDVSRLIEREFPSRVVLTGEDRFLGYSLLRGSRGALIGMAAVLPGFQKRLVVAARSGAAAEAVRLMGCADRLAETLFVPPLEAYIRRLLFVLSVLGVIDEDAAHDPWFPAALEADEKAAIARTVAELAEETAGG
jgi:4-hydroxy-tetrahydrodipicolinate synthase